MIKYHHIMAMIFALGKQKNGEEKAETREARHTGWLRRREVEKETERIGGNLTPGSASLYSCI